MWPAGFTLALLGGIGTPELVVILVVALLLFGPKNLPKMARSLGKAMEEFRRAAHEVQTELTREPEPPSEKMSLPEPPPDSAAPAPPLEPAPQLMPASAAPSAPEAPVASATPAEPAPAAAPAAGPAPETHPPQVAKEERSAHGPAAT